MVAYQSRMMIPKICTNDKTSMTIQINHGGQLEFQVGKRPKRRPVKFPPVTPTSAASGLGSCGRRVGLATGATEAATGGGRSSKGRVLGKTGRLGEDYLTRRNDNPY